MPPASPPCVYLSARAPAAVQPTATSCFFKLAVAPCVCRYPAVNTRANFTGSGGGSVLGRPVRAAPAVRGDECRCAAPRGPLRKVAVGSVTGSRDIDSEISPRQR